MTTHHPLGRIVRDEDGVALLFERRLGHPPERVWRALTESDQLRHWLPADIVGAREEGAPVLVTFWDDVAQRYAIDEPVMTGRILTWDPPRRFVWLWDDELLTFDLTPVDGGTDLALTVRVGTKAPAADKVAAGYHVCLDQLAALVDT
ncbi:SRPBCC domain-containing protein, partial [Aquipuribacter nitratireducens]